MKLFLNITLMALSLSASLFSWALTNSQPAISDELQSVVMIRTEAQDPSDGSSVPAYCNATFVHPLVLATAAHCVSDAYTLKKFSVQIQVGKYKFVTRPDGTVVRIGYVQYLTETKVARFVFTTGLTSKINSQGFKIQIGPQEDMALIILSSALALPDSVKMMTVVSQQELNGLAPSVGQYMPTIVTINPFEYVTTSDTKQFSLLNQSKWNGSGYFESTSAARVQPGDSGAPVLVKIGNTWKLIGVVKGKASSLFGDWDVFSGLDNKACDLANQTGNAEAKALICH